MILVDNVVRDGALVEEGTSDERALGMRRFHELAGRQPRGYGRRPSRRSD